MSPDEHRRLAELEDSLWHFAALHGNVARVLRRAQLPAAFELLDVGCGTGGFLRRLQRWWPQARLRGVDPAPVATALARGRVSCPIDDGGLPALPYADASFDAITCLDVACQVEDPAAAYREMARCLRPGGVLVTNEPAHRWLWSYHDEKVGDRHRFNRRELRQLLAAAGLRPYHGTHWNFLLLPLVWLRRRVGPRPTGSDVRPYPGWVSGPLRVLTLLEQGWLAAGGRFPVGVSVLAAARKDSAAALFPD